MLYRVKTAIALACFFSSILVQGPMFYFLRRCSFSFVLVMNCNLFIPVLNQKDNIASTDDSYEKNCTMMFPRGMLMLGFKKVEKLFFCMWLRFKLYTLLLLKFFILGDICGMLLRAYFI
jgi:hypothetical protein